MRLTRTNLLATFLTAFLAASLSSTVLATSPAETQAETGPAETPAAGSTEQPVAAPDQSGAASDPEVSGEVLPLLPPQSPNAEVSAGVLPLLPEPAAPGVARGVAVEELPLLVTEPPAEGSDVEIPVPVTGGNDSLLNPFSPLLLPQPRPQAAPPAAAPPAAPPAVAAPPVQEAAPAPTAAAPAPAPTAPVPLPQARVGRPALPRSLTASLRSTVPLTTDLSADPLTRALDVQSSSANALGPASELAAVRAPSSLTPLGTAPARGAATARIPSGTQQVALGSGLSTLGLGGGNSAGDGNFTSLGGNRVSRALSSLQVHFTAMATGTAIFRLGNDTTPILLAPGDSLPGTGLILTGLTSRGAQFTEDDVRHTLFLTP